jgi:multidrug efflux pump subunit AcrB
VQGPNVAQSREHAEKIRLELQKVASLRDLQYAQPLDYPTLEINIDRQRAGQLGVDVAAVAKSVVGATSSSRLTDLNFWRDPRSGNGFQIQVQLPENTMGSIEDVQNVPIRNNADGDGTSTALLSDIAQVGYGTTLGEVDRYNMQRVVSLTANIHDKPLGNVTEEVLTALKRVDAPPRGTTVSVRGQIPALEDSLSGLRIGLLLSIVVIFLLLSANFQSLRLALAVILTVPAVLVGVLLMLIFTGTTLNVQSFMGAIMAIGIAVANAILLLTFAEMSRSQGNSVLEAAIEGGAGRLRAILMTAAAMIAGMIPIALGIGEGADQTTPLGRAVIGGLTMATFATLFVLPSLYSILQARSSEFSPSLDPNDSSSKYYENT